MERKNKKAGGSWQGKDAAGCLCVSWEKRKQLEINWSFQSGAFGQCSLIHGEWY